MKIQIFRSKRSKRIQDRLGKYPCCDHINIAIRHILDNDPDNAIDELYQAITKANGYFYEDLRDKIIEVHNIVSNSRK